MKNSLILILASLTLSTACVQESGSISKGDSVETTAGSGGGTTGSVQQPGVEDPLAAHAWHLENNAQATFSSGVGIAGEDVSVRSVIESGITGLGVRVAVSDSGTDIDHEDLSGNQLVGEHRDYFISNPSLWRTSLPHYVDDDAHGTATVGLIAALGWNGLGSRGIAPKAKYAAFRFVGEYSSTPSSQLARDIDQADGNFDIFNYSYGYPQCYFIEQNPLALEAFRDGVKNLRNGLGTLYVQSAGNDYRSSKGKCIGDENDLTSFAGNSNHSDDLAIPEKIVVGAVNASGVKSSYSTPGSNVWVSAPGGEYGDNLPAMLTTDISGCSHGYSFFTYAYNAFNRGSSPLNNKCNYTALMNGTSSAAPVVSGVIALILEANPALSWRDVKHILALTSDEVDSVNDVLPHPRGAGFNLAGHDYDYRWTTNGAGLRFSNWYGFGRVNASRAVNMARSYPYFLGSYETTTNPVTDEWYYDSGTISVNIPNYNSIGSAFSTLESVHNFYVESVQVEVSIDHPSPQDLAITVISPSGTESRMLTINSNVEATSMPDNKLLLSNAFYGETSAGEWKIHVVDGGGTAGDGTLTNWRIKINGRKVDGDGTFPAIVTDVAVATTYGSSGSNASTPPITFTNSAAVDVVRYEVSIGTTAGLRDVAEWTSIGLANTNVQLRKLRLAPNTFYTLGIRAIDNMENASGVVYRTWKTN